MPTSDGAGIVAYEPCGRVVGQSSAEYAVGSRMRRGQATLCSDHVTCLQSPPRSATGRSWRNGQHPSAMCGRFPQWNLLLQRGSSVQAGSWSRAKRLKHTIDPTGNVPRVRTLQCRWQPLVSQRLIGNRPHKSVQGGSTHRRGRWV